MVVSMEGVRASAFCMINNHQHNEINERLGVRYIARAEVFSHLVNGKNRETKLWKMICKNQPKVGDNLPPRRNILP